MNDKIIYNFVNILEKYINYTDKYKSNITKIAFNNGFILLKNIYMLMILKVDNISLLNLLEKSYIYYIEFLNNINSFNPDENPNNYIELANVFCIKKIFNDNTSLESNDNISLINSDYIYIILNIITNLYINLYHNFTNYNQRNMFNVAIIKYILDKDTDINMLNETLIKVNNLETNSQVSSIIGKYIN